MDGFIAIQITIGLLGICIIIWAIFEAKKFK